MEKMKENTNVAIQGVKGSFHHAVANSYYGKNLSLMECETFDATVNALMTAALVLSLIKVNTKASYQDLN